MCDISQITQRDQEAGKLHSGLQEFHDRFLGPQLDIVTSDPAKFLAWLVLISTLITLLVGHLVYLGLLCLLSITWLYLGNISLKSGKREEEREEEWLLDRFLCFLHQLDNDRSDINQQERGEESETEEGGETVSSAVTLLPADSSSTSLADHQLEEWEDFEFITAQDLSS